MQYIVIDLEWNQPISRESSVYRRVGDRLIFEMIQIGAVKISRDMKITDSVSIPIRPQQYVHIHPRIRRMTSLGEEELAEAATFQEAMEQFTAWCGADPVLLTWGCDDISVWRQNLDFYEDHREMPRFCDIQGLFSEVNHCERKSLSAAMEMLGIDPDESRAFHNALNDAYYTAQVFVKMPDPEAVLSFEQKPKQLIRHRQAQGSRREPFAGVAEALGSEQARTPACPLCGKPMPLEDRYAQQAGDKYIGLARCRNHGRMLVRVRLEPDGETGCLMTVRTGKAGPADSAYVHTKLLQIRNREEKLAAQGIVPDPDRELREAERSSMPSDD